MYSGPLHRPPFSPDESTMQHQAQREELTRQLMGAPSGEEPSCTVREREKESGEEKNLLSLLEMVSPEDSALIALIVFLLCDNTDNDVVLLGILLYVLLSK